MVQIIDVLEATVYFWALAASIIELNSSTRWNHFKNTWKIQKHQFKQPKIAIAASSARRDAIAPFTRSFNWVR